MTILTLVYARPSQNKQLTAPTSSLPGGATPLIARPVPENDISFDAEFHSCRIRHDSYIPHWSLWAILPFEILPHKFIAPLQHDFTLHAGRQPLSLLRYISLLSRLEI
jgi:hypothetical protein